MSKCTTNALINMIKEIRVESLEEVDYVRFSQEIDRDVAEGILKNARALDLEGVHDLAVILDHLIHYFAEGKVHLK